MSPNSTQGLTQTEGLMDLSQRDWRVQGRKEGGGKKKKGLVGGERPPLGSREAQSLASSEAPRLFQKEAVPNWDVRKAFGWKERSLSAARKIPGWLPGLEPGPGWPSAPPRGSAASSGPQRPSAEGGWPGEAGTGARGSRARGPAAHVGRPAAFPPGPRSLPPPGRGPRAASARPLGGACALGRASLAQAKATAEPGGAANLSPRIPGTGGQRRQPR